MQSEEKVMKLNGNSLDEVLKKETLSDEDIVFLLGLTDPEDCTKLQQAAYDALGENKGAVIVMEADTGKILTLVSKPDFDPKRQSRCQPIHADQRRNSERSVVCGRKRLRKHLSSGR